MPNYSKIAGSLSELLAKLPKGSAAAQDAIRLEMELEAARQAAMYAPHTLPTAAGAEAIEKAKKITGKADGGVVSLDELVNAALQRAPQKMGVGGGVKTASQKLVSFIEKLAKEQKAAEKAGDIETALQKNKELKSAIQSGVNSPAMPRAKPLSDAEIQAFAERMAPQVTGELTRGKSGAKTVAGKTQQQFQREKTLPVDRSVLKGQRDPMAPLPEMTLEQQKGGVLLGLPGDPTLARMELSGIGDVAFERPVTLHGGPRYGDDEKLWASNIAGASNLVGAGRRASEQYGGAPVYASFMKMPEGFGFAQHYLDSLMQYTRPDQLPKEARLALEADIRKGFKDSKKKYEFPEFAGFDDLGVVSEQALRNSKLRGHIADRLEKSKLYGLRPAGDVEFAVTHPELTNIETGAGGFTIGELPLNQPFSASAHPTYTHDIPGKVLGQTRHPTPYDLLYRDQLEMVKKNPVIADEPFGTVKLLGARQKIDEQLVNEINEYQERMRSLIGKKNGGLAEGGVPEKRDVSQLFPLKVPADNAELKPQPKYPLLEKASQGVQSIHDFVSAPFGYENPAGEMVSSFLEVPSIAKALGNMAYDLPMTTGSGMTTDLRPEVSGAAMGVAPLVGPAVKTAKKVGKALAPTAAEMALDIASKYGVDPRMNIIKPKGGNWLAGSVDDATKRVKRYSSPPINREAELLAEVEEANKLNLPGYLNAATNDLQQLRIDMAADKWVEKKLNPYIKNEMGTETDPIRLGIERRAAEGEKLKQINQTRLAKMEADIAKAKAAGKDTTLSEGDLEKAREKFANEEYIATQGLFHKTIPEAGWTEPPPPQPYLTKRREREGMPIEDISTHPAAKRWERAVDMETEPIKASRYQEDQNILDKNPYLSKLAPDSSVYSLDAMSDATFEFRHMMDEVKEAMNPQTVLPKSLRISPKDLEKMTVDDVSALSGKISAWRDTQKVKANLEADKNPAIHLFKEYTENNPKGVSWRQIKLPEELPLDQAKALVREATKYEGDMMRHCVGGAGHCEPLINGDVEIYSLRDAKGEPHVTIEVSAKPNPKARGNTPNDFYLSLPMEEMAKIPPRPRVTNSSHAEIDRWDRMMSNSPQYQEWLQSKPKQILEIKGKNNRKPNPEYIPFVQDFIKSGKWSNINDLHHTDLQPTKGTPWRKTYESYGMNIPEYVSAQEYDDIVKQYNVLLRQKNAGKAHGGAVKMAEGGAVSLDDLYAQALENSAPVSLDDLVHQAIAKNYAEGGAAYNTTPDMSDGGRYMQGEAF